MPRGPKPNKNHSVLVDDVSGVLPLVQSVKKQGNAGYREGPLIFHEFIRTVFPDYRFGRVHQEIVRQCQGVLDGKVKRLLVQISPQSGKSLLTSQLLTAAYITKHPSRKVGLCSYNQEMACEHSVAARDFYALAGGQLSSTLQGNWRNISGGGVWATGVGGSVTGKSNSGLLVVDDPIKNLEEAESPAAMEKLWNWYYSAFRARKQPHTAIVIIHTRWTQNDLIGRLLDIEAESPEEAKEHWTMLDFPALYEPPDVRPTIPKSCVVIPDWRTKEDEVLCSFRYNENDLKSDRATNPRVFAAIYQQRPIPSTGKIFNVNNFQEYKVKNISVQNFSRRILSVDCSFQKSNNSDYVVITHIGDAMPDFYVLDVWRKRLDFVETLQMILRVREAVQPHGILVEAAANGPAIIQTLKRKIPGVIPFGHTRTTRGMGYSNTQTNRKIANAQSVTPLVDAGNIWIPDTAPWLDAWLGELADFPGKRDDQVDSLVMGLIYLMPQYTNMLVGADWGNDALPALPY